MSLIERPAYLLAFSIVLACAFGLGRLVLGRDATSCASRTAVGHGLVGALILVDGFSLGLQLSLPFWPVATLLGASSALGMGVWMWSLAREPDQRRRRLLLWLLPAGLLILVSWLPVDPNSTDSVFYAYMTGTALQAD